MIRMGPHGGRSGPAKSDAVEGNMEDQEALDLAADWADISQGLRKDDRVPQAVLPGLPIRVRLTALRINVVARRD